jgi:hypothetical protein
MGGLCRIFKFIELYPYNAAAVKRENREGAEGE